MKIQIKNRFTMDVIFEHEADSFKLAVEFAAKSRANLSRANLYVEKINKTPIQMLGIKWCICITENHIQIGCQIHKAVEWFTYSDDEINKMHSEALEFWTVYKPIIKVLWEEHTKEKK